MAAAALSGYPPLFAAAVERVLANEGGYSHLPEDPGGATNFGISQRDYPKLDIANLTREDAIGIYFRDFWKAGRFEELPTAVAIKVFDLSVNIGAARATHCLQRALRACGARLTEDGAMGNSTLLAANHTDGAMLLAALRSEAAGYYRATVEGFRRAGREGADSFLEGWLNRAYQ